MPPLARVDHDDGDTVGNRDGRDVERRAVHQQRVAFDAEQRRELVHDPAGDTRSAVLGTLARERDLHTVDSIVADQSERHRHFERRTRRQPGTDRDGGSHLADEADGRP